MTDDGAPLVEVRDLHKHFPVGGGLFGRPRAWVRAVDGVSLGYMMNQAANNSALFYHMWWVFIPPGAVLALMVFALLIANVGLDEVFNPKLREQ